MKRLKVLDEMLKYFDSSELLEEVIRALDTDTALDILDFIARMHDINID